MLRWMPTGRSKLLRLMGRASLSSARRSPKGANMADQSRVKIARPGLLETVVTKHLGSDKPDSVSSGDTDVRNAIFYGEEIYGLGKPSDPAKQPWPPQAAQW